MCWLAERSAGGKRRGETRPLKEGHLAARKRPGLTPFSQVLVQIPEQTEGYQASRATGTISARVLRTEHGLKLSPELPGQLLRLQLSAGAQSAQKPLARNQRRRHSSSTPQSGDLPDSLSSTSARRAPEAAARPGGGPRGRGRARGSVGRGRDVARPRLGPWVSSHRAGGRPGGTWRVVQPGGPWLWALVGGPGR